MHILYKLNVIQYTYVICMDSEAPQRYDRIITQCQRELLFSVKWQGRSRNPTLAAQNTILCSNSFHQLYFKFFSLNDTNALLLLLLWHIHEFPLPFEEQPFANQALIRSSIGAQIFQQFIFIRNRLLICLYFTGAQKIEMSGNGRKFLSKNPNPSNFSILF